MSKVLLFLQITVEHQDCPFVTVFLTIKTSSQIISTTLSQISLQLHKHRDGHWRKKLPRTRDTAAVIYIGNGVISLLPKVYSFSSDFFLLLKLRDLHFDNICWSETKGAFHLSELAGRTSAPPLSLKNTVKPVLSGHRIKRTPSIKRTVAEVLKFISLIYLK